jgi:predicted DCC family thiol-disulfide oxidoreductase YuxK
MQYDNLIFFDGVCNLCNSTVQWIITHDPQARFRFVALQSETAQTILQQYGIQLQPQDLNTILLLQNERIFSQSTAVLRICKHLSGVWKLAYGFLLVPTFIRNFFYAIVSQNRYRWFGKEESCWIPTPELRQRFLA